MFVFFWAGSLYYQINDSDSVNSISKQQILDLKAFENGKINETKKQKIFLRCQGSIAGKGKVLVNNIFSFSHIVSKGIYFRVVKSRDCVVQGIFNHSTNKKSVSNYSLSIYTPTKCDKNLPHYLVISENK